MPTSRRRPADYAGWTVPEFVAEISSASSAVASSARAGREAVRLVMRSSGNLPVEAVLIARSIADSAPPAGSPVTPALRDILDRYLPQSVSAFDASRPAPLRARAEALLLTQLRLLHHVATKVRQAEAEHDDRDLQVQEAFLRERFAGLSAEGSLDLTSVAPTPDPYPVVAPEVAAAVAQRGTVHLTVEHDPVVALGPADDGAGAAASRPLRTLSLRLALPRGRRTTLGVVAEGRDGGLQFSSTVSSRWSGVVLPGAVGASQVDVTTKLDVSALRRFIVYAEAPAAGPPMDAVLVAADNLEHEARLPTVLTGRATATLTVVGSGFAYGDGLVLRNESMLFPDLRAACQGFGFTRITWLNGRTPIQ